MRIAELQRQTGNYNAQIGGYQSRVEAAPRVEQALISVQREYDLERNSYNDLTGKKQAALLNEEVQRRQGGEQFAVLVPAGLPDEPFKPKPLRVMLMALAAGLVLGGAAMVGREYLDRSVHDARGLRDEFELPVLAEIPHIEPVMGQREDTNMSRIQNILDKAEREGAALRTGRLPGAPPAAPITPITSAAVPVSIEIPTPPSVVDAPAIVPGSPSVAANAAAPEIESYTARLNPLLVAGLA